MKEGFGEAGDDSPMTKAQLCETVIDLLIDPNDNRSTAIRICREVLENELVLDTPVLELPLLMGSLKYPSSRRILERRMREGVVK